MHIPIALLSRRLLAPAAKARSSTLLGSLRTSCTLAVKPISPQSASCFRSYSSSSSPSSSVEREKVLTVPNLLCLSRIAASPYLVHLVATGQHQGALAVFAYAGVTDLVRTGQIVVT